MRLSLSLNIYLLAALVFGSALFVSPAHAQSGNECGFTRTLEVGVDGEDVRCLQKFLNANGFVIAESGPGSPGNETSLFRELTRQAVAKWQTAKGVAPSSGIFGDKSRATYLLSMVGNLQGQLPTTPIAVVPTPTPVVAGVSTSADIEKIKAAAWLKELIDLLEETDELIDDADADEQVELEADIRDVRVDVYALILSFLAGDYDEVNSDASNVVDDAADVFEDAGGESEKDETEEKIEDIAHLIEEVEDLIAESKDDREDIGDAEDLLDEARDYYDDAVEALDGRSYRQAMSDALDAEELLEDALDEIGVVSDDDAETYVEDVWEAFDDAEVDIDEANEDGEDVEESEELLDDAERELKRADIAIDEEEWDEAIEFAEKAEDLIDEALDAIGGSTGDEDDAEDNLDDAWERYRDLSDEVEEADDDGEDMSDAEDYLDEAKDLLDEADDAFDDEDWDEVLDLVEEIEDLLDDVEDEL